MSSFDIVGSNIMQNFFQVTLGKGGKKVNKMLGLVFFNFGLMVPQSYHRLFGNVHQIFDVVILVLLKGGEQHVQDLLFVGSRSFARFLLFLLVLQLQKKKRGVAQKRCISSECPSATTLFTEHDS